MWSIGNEEGWIHTNSNGKRIAQTLFAKQKELDPSRTSTYAADVANVFNGVNEVIPVRGFNYRQFAVADYHRDHPNQPMLELKWEVPLPHGAFMKKIASGDIYPIRI